ncbi:hypothetical protein R55210_AODCCCNP_00101 [Fructobacillus fructosus]|uniref:hypothetical protein n=1 Tax=Fructobacillus fructosus TaxID=1631 RepID=UPI0006754298|nr:hypothetical protein [Fructobacillus fructosus]KRN53324.1 SAM-dependent methyltransferase [Fructobacillus fructosus KCTC 3544]GAP00698.1 hypothetical protein FFRU_011020 [Fructobacillus fructosus]CAK1225512.1 hypothetical protein R55210_AODCCCNP_00101 [Fructobacillus fructosus]
MLTVNELNHLTTRYQERPKQLAQIEAVSQALVHLANQRLPASPLPPLLYSEKQLMRDPSLLPLDQVFGGLRETMIKEYGLWFLPNQALVQDLADWLAGRPLVELAAGNAALSASLLAAGAHAVAVDSLDWVGQDIEQAEPWTTVEQLDALDWVMNEIQAVQQGKKDSLPVFLMAWWPNGNAGDWSILQALRQSALPFTLIVIGEPGPYTNSQSFWAKAQLTKDKRLNKHYQPFDDYQDALYFAQ